MTRDELTALVKKEASEIIPGLDPRTVDTSASLRDQGASSLDVVELMSLLMRKLRLKVSRDELAKVSTLDGLIDLFLQASSRRREQAPQ